jgi:hypothetical protein
MVRRTRQDILKDLVALAGPVHPLEDELRGYGWDSEVELVVLTAADALSVLDRFARGDITAEECAGWADALVGRDGVGFEPAFEDTLKNLLFEICVPEINGPLTRDSAARWKAQLASPAPG